MRIILSAARMLLLNPLRAGLTLTGLAIGIAAVVIIMSIGDGTRSTLLAQIETMGSNVTTVDAGLVRDVNGRSRQASRVTTLKERDADAILHECAAVDAVAPTQERTLAVKHDGKAAMVRIIGTMPAYRSIRNYAIASGRFFSQDDNDRSQRTAVIGKKCADAMFHTIDPVGETITINAIPFRVIGVLRAKGSSFDGANEDDVVLIPFKTGMRRVFNLDYCKNIYVHVTAREKMPEAEREIRVLLRDRHRLDAHDREDDFTIQNAYTALRVRQEADDSFTNLILAAAVLSLLVAGVGILATMLLSVRERKPEIGLRVAIGATRLDILVQFLLEAVTLSVSGGMVGIGAGAAGTLIVGHFMESTVRFSAEAAVLSFVVSMLIGVVFGSYPARKASRMEPIMALKA